MNEEKFLFNCYDCNWANPSFFRATYWLPLVVYSDAQFSCQYQHDELIDRKTVTNIEPHNQPSISVGFLFSLQKIQYSGILNHSPEIFVVTVSRCGLENQLPPLFLKIGLLVSFVHHNFVICKVTAITLWIPQAYTNSLVLFCGYLYAFSSVCAIKCYLQNCRQNMWKFMRLS